MQVAAMESPEEGEHTNKRKTITVFYRCSHFSAGLEGGVRVSDNRVCCTLLFVVPRTCDTARSLQWVGSSLAPLVYPRRFHQRLQRLWSRLIAEMSLPTWASCLEVAVDFGILRTADRTTKRMKRMSAALKGSVGKDFHPKLHAELWLPEELPGCGAAEDCPICLEMLQGNDLVMWPGCSKPHVFHGTCLDPVLEKSDKCPLCRNLWYIEPKFLIIYNEREESGCETDMARDSGAGGKVKNVMQEMARWFGEVCNIVWYHTKVWLILAIAS
jgi:hypothetical protein